MREKHQNERMTNVTETTTTAPEPVAWIPRDDSFGARLALVRQRMGWDNKQASLECGLPQSSWLRYESGSLPRDFVTVASKISKRTGVDAMWLMTGDSTSKGRPSD